jgi:hypothetical protein
MSKERLLIVLIVVDVFLAFAGMGVEMFFNWTLPAPLREYKGSGGFGLPQFALLYLWGLTALCAIVAWIGLLNYWWFARRLYVISVIATTTLTLVAGPSVMSAPQAAMSRVNSLVAGAILGLVYFSDLARRFERSSEAVTNGAHVSA